MIQSKIKNILQETEIKKINQKKFFITVLHIAPEKPSHPSTRPIGLVEDKLGKGAETAGFFVGQLA